MNNGRSFAQIKPALVKRVILTDLDDVEFDEALTMNSKPERSRFTAGTQTHTVSAHRNSSTFY